MSEQARIAFIGGGNMARSLIGALVRGGTPADAIAVAEPNAELRALLARDFGVAVHDTALAAAAGAGVIVLAVKPQVMKAVCVELAASIAQAHPLLISIAAGIRIGQLAAWLGKELPIVRSMPNTPALIGAGATGMIANHAASAAQREQARAILGAAGTTVWIDDEDMMDTVTALSGSGPAYVFLLAEEMARAGIEAGLPADLATKLARETVAGSGELLRRSEQDSATLRQNVTSPGGTTAAALEVLMGKDGMQPLMIRAIAAATRRSKELAK